MSAAREGGGADTALTAPLRPGTPDGGAPAVFLDKDGTLVENVPFNVDPTLLRFTAKAPEALRLLSHAGYALAVVTNQPGIAGGRFSKAAFDILRRSLVDRIRDEAGVAVAAFEFCPHLPDPSGRPACACRKPQPGMLERAALAGRFDLSRSWMIGDILDDVEAGRRAGCRTVLLDVGNETQWQWSPIRVPDLRCGDLLEAATLIAGAR
jgi:histidinol-phosphate phosphatase family protein